MEMNETTKMAADNVAERRRVECPFSRGRLHELHWDELLSPAQIGVKAGEMLDRKPVAETTVRGWFNSLDVPMAGRAEGRRRTQLKLKERGYDHLIGRRWSLTEDAKKELSRRLRRAHANKPKLPQRPVEERGYPQLFCASCGAAFYREWSVITAAFKRTIQRQSDPNELLFFCSISCRSKTPEGKTREQVVYEHQVQDWWVRVVDGAARRCGYEFVPEGAEEP